MPFFSRKSKARSKEAWDQAKYDYKEAIQRCYRWERVTLALYNFQRSLEFNVNSNYFSESKRKPFVETDLKFRGVVHEHGQFEKHVLCEMKVSPASSSDDYIGRLFLHHISMPNDKTRREEQLLELGVYVYDPTAMLKASLIDGLRDAALSGFRFIHVVLECQASTKQELEKAESDIRGRGYAAHRDILSVAMRPKIELQNAPAWARKAY